MISMASSRKRNLNQHCNDNEQDQDHDEYRITRNNSCGLLLHDYPSRHVHRRLSHVQVQERFPLRLKLEISDSFIKKIESTLTQEKQETNHQQVLNQPQRPRRMNASNFPAVFLRIGSWNWASRNKGDLMIKFYYGKKKLLWEFIIGSLKKKIEIGWNNVSAINAYVDDDNMGRLEVELMEPPELYNECNFQALKHTQWERSNDDFTGGQAQSCKRHSIVFSPGILHEHLEKLLQHDTRLLNLSRQPFPIHNSTYFNANMDAAYHNHQGTVVPSVQPITSCTVENLHSNLPMPDVPYPNLDERNNGVLEQSEINHIQTIPLSSIMEEDYDRVLHELEQLIHQDNSSPCGNEMNDNGINHDVGLLDIGPGLAFTEENITSSSDCGLSYVACADDDVSGFPELQFINDGPEIQDPDYWLSSPHDILNGELPRQDSNSLGGSSG